MRVFALYSTLLFVPFAAWAGQVQDPSLTLPYDTTQDLANVVKIFTDSYNAYRSVSTQVEFGTLIDMVVRPLQDIRVWTRRGGTNKQNSFGPAERVGRYNCRRIVDNGKPRVRESCRPSINTCAFLANHGIDRRPTLLMSRSCLLTRVSTVLCY